jgi:hypothetical protein
MNHSSQGSGDYQNPSHPAPGKGMRLLQAIFLVAVTIQALASLHDRFIKGGKQTVKAQD